MNVFSNMPCALHTYNNGPIFYLYSCDDPKVHITFFM